MRKWLAIIGLVLGAYQAAYAHTVVVLGDSISAAFGMDTEQGWVTLLQKRLKDEGKDWQIVNASVSGDTTAGGLARVSSLLEEHQPSWLVLELGGNDGLRGLPLNQVQQNLSMIMHKAQQAGSQVLLLGMQLPPNYGPRYTQGFVEIYPALANQYKSPLVPFLLEGVGGVEGMMQSDGIHPSVLAQPILLENVWTVWKERL